MQDLPSQSCQDLIAGQLPFLPKEKHTEGLLQLEEGGSSLWYGNLAVPQHLPPRNQGSLAIACAHNIRDQFDEF